MHLRILVLLALAVLAAQARHKSWAEPANLSAPCPLFVDDDTGKESWADPGAATACAPCCERCYVLRLNATVVNGAASNTQFCRQTGAGCPLVLFLQTSPCTLCAGGSVHHTQEQCGADTCTVTHEAQSKCEAAEFAAHVGPDCTRLSNLYTACNTTYPVASVQAEEGASQVLELKECAQSNVGAYLRAQFDAYYGAINWPDPCFWDRHFESGYVEVRGPPSGTLVWLHAPLPRGVLPVSCNKYREARDKCEGV